MDMGWDEVTKELDQVCAQLRVTADEAAHEQLLLEANDLLRVKRRLLNRLERTRLWKARRS